MFPLKDKYAGIIEECTTNGTPRFTNLPFTTTIVVELNKFPIISSNDTIHHLYKEDEETVKINETKYTTILK